eukprot:13487466-Heterocapsa_arctica.AAC.1
MSAQGDGKGKGKGKGEASHPADANGQPPWYMENGKDIRADKPCRFLAAGYCKLGPTCPWNHKMEPGKSVDSAAAPSGDPTKKEDRPTCRNFQET